MKKTVILPNEHEYHRYCNNIFTSHGPNEVHLAAAEILSTEFIIDQKKYDDMVLTERTSSDVLEIKITHPAKVKYGDLTYLVDGVHMMDKFIKNMKKAAKGYSSVPGLSDEQISTLSNQYKGDVFEVFVEALIKTHGVDRRIGISDYKPINTQNGQEDLGVDGHGIGTNGKVATVQVKFRSEHNYVLTANADGLSNFKNSSHEMYGVDFNDNENMLIVTTAADIHHFTRYKMLNGKVRCLTLDGIEKLVNNNINFWTKFRAMLQHKKTTTDVPELT
jgi:hypothetical protein